MNVYLTTLLANIENERCIEILRTELGRDVIGIYAKGSARDVETQILSVVVLNIQIHKTGYLSNKGVYWSKSHVSCM